MGATGQSITLANSIIGVGILAMPFCFQKCGVLLATLILLSMGLVSRLCCHFLLKSALLARRRNFEFLAFHVFGSAGKVAVELGIIGFLMGTCIAYFVVVGDLGPQIIAKMFNINQSDMLRTSIMVLVSLVCVLPLGLLRNVDSLSNVSAATIGFYFCLVIKVISEAASQLLSAERGPGAAAGLGLGPGARLWRAEGVLQCVPIFSMALFCQTQLFEIFESMPTLSLEKMNAVTKNAINICTSVYFTLGLFGYIAFGKHDISGNILMSLSPTMASDVIKLGFVLSLAFSFPLVIFPCRASLYSFLYKKVHSSQHDHIINHSIPERAFRCITVGIVSGALGVSLLVPDVERVLGLAGATIGVLVCVAFPAACFLSLTSRNTTERVLAKAMLVLGLVILVLGSYANLRAGERAPDKYDEHITQERIDQLVEDFFHKRDKDGAIVKAPQEIEKLLNEDGKHSNEAIADSEVQPPNPVPPESQPDEKQQPPSPEKVLDITDKKETPKEPKQEIDKVSETHPRNLNKITDEKRSNGENKKQKTDTQIKEEIKQMSNQQKIDLLKQAQLAETIKQHGEEQKELIKEQKEILDNIIKTKQEIQQDKNEAKKIAVESIQKIANVAIQSLSAVSEQPAPSDGKIEVGDTANEAVKKIADVAVEAIKEIKDKPIEALPVINDANIVAQVPEAKAVPLVPVQNIVNEVKQNEPVAQIPIDNVNLNPAKQDVLLQNSEIKVDQTNSNIRTAVHEAAAAANNNVEANPQQINNIKPIVNALKDSNLAAKKPAVKLPPNNIVPNIQVQQVNNNNAPENVDQKTHSHSPDEPQSYKQGEDLQKIPDNKNNILNNVPLPLAMNGNHVKSAQIEQEKPLDVQNGAKQMNLDSIDKSVPRQKREVVLDCSNKAILRAEDKEICMSVPRESPPEILPEVDLRDALPKQLPALDLNIIHQIRSLKSYDDEKRR